MSASRIALIESKWAGAASVAAGTVVPRLMGIQSAQLKPKDLAYGLEPFLPLLRRYDEHETACLYFLIQRREVVYIGQTTNLRTRIGSHRQDKWKAFNRVLYIPAPGVHLGEVEDEMIQLYRPIHNRTVRYE